MVHFFLILPAFLGIVLFTQSVHWTRSDREVKTLSTLWAFSGSAINRQVYCWTPWERSYTPRELCRKASVAVRTPWHIFLVKISWKIEQFLKPCNLSAMPKILKRGGNTTWYDLAFTNYKWKCLISLYMLLVILLEKCKGQYFNTL